MTPALKPKRNWLRISLVAQIMLAVYFQVMAWIPLGRWNYQPGYTMLLEQCLSGRAGVVEIALPLLFALPVLLFYIAYRRGYSWLMWVGLAGYSFWLIMQIQTWWVNYVFGASDDWMKIYNRAFSESTKILPSFGRHVAPDGMHTTLQVLLAIAVVTLFLGLVTSKSKSVKEI